MTIELSSEALKNFQKIPHAERKKIQRKIDSLAANPLLGKKLDGKLKDFRSVRAWPYRIIYLLELNIITVVRIGHRQGAYD